MWISACLLMAMLALATLPTPVTGAPRTQDDPQAQADALVQEGMMLLEGFGDPLAAYVRFAQALPLYQEADDRSGEALCRYGMGVTLLELKYYSDALADFEAALAIYQEVGDPAGEGWALDRMGVTYRLLAEYEQALACNRRALAIFREIADVAGERSALGNITAVYVELGHYEQADALYEEGIALLEAGQLQAAFLSFEAALPLYQAASDRGGEARCLLLMASVKERVGDYLGALEVLEAILPIWEEIDQQEWQALTLNYMGGNYHYLGKYQQALDYYRRALAILEQIGDEKGQWTTHNQIGVVYYNLGRSDLALEHFRRALAMARDSSDPAGKGAALSRIGMVYDHVGQYRQALDYLQQAVDIQEEIDDLGELKETLNNIGGVYFHLGQYQQALDHFRRALAVARDSSDPVWELGVLVNLIGVCLETGQYDLALSLGEQALDIGPDLLDQKNRAVMLGNLGTLYYHLARYEQALDYLNQSLAISQEIGHRAGEGLARNNIGYVYASMGQYDRALDYYQQSLNSRQEAGDRAGEGVTLANIGLVYQDQGDTAQAVTLYQQAIEVKESIHAEIKIEELQAAFAAEQVPVYERLINLLWEEGREEEAFNYGERARARAFLDQLARGAVDFRASTASTLLAQERDLSVEIAARRAQLVTLRSRPGDEWDTEAIAAVQAELTSLESDYAALLTQLKLQSPESVSLVSVDVASLGDIQSLLNPNTTLVAYFVTEDATLAFIITRDTFETVALDVTREELSDTITTFRDFASLEDPHPATVRQLHSWLIAPIETRLTTSTVGIVPHGVLHYLPFAALTDGERYLSEDYVLFTLPSASALPFIQEKRKPDPDTLLALGNPTIADPLPLLRFAQQEAEAIADLYQTEALVGPDAAESAVWSRAGNVGILHLAAHGAYNPYNPLFSTIYLAGDSENDGRLEVHEIYGLDLTTATDLVVLSACQTQIGKISAGDEVVGLSRAFLYAGTPSVIASLWSVDDEATGLLMERFYTHLRAGLSKGEALRQAQIDVRAEYPHPYYWAAFVLTGDAGEVTETPPEPTSGRALCLSAALPLGLVLLAGIQRQGTLRNAR